MKATAEIQKITKTTSTRFNGNSRANSFFAPVIQPKLTVNQPGDQYEREADAVSEKIMRMHDRQTSKPFYAASSVIQRCQCDRDEKLRGKEKPPFEKQNLTGDAATVQRKCTACEEEEKLHRKESGLAIPTITPAVTQTLSSNGQSLDPVTRTFMETRFGHDFGDVQVHDNYTAHKSAADIHAKAYTHGRHIVFNAGEYKPNTNTGRKILAHELTHVLQQNFGGGLISRQAETEKKCPFSDVKRTLLLSLPLPWGLQAGDTQVDIERKQGEMRRDQDLLTLLNQCVISSGQLYNFVTSAEGYCIQDIIEAVEKGRPFPIISHTKSGRVYEAIADPRPLSRGTQNPNLKYRVTGPDASTGAAVTMPDLATPQCGDVCNAADRNLTAEQLQNDDVAVRSCCSMGECTEISNKASIASQYTTRAISRMRAGLAMNESMEKHFKKSNTAMYADVLEGLERILPEVNFASHNWICRESGRAAEGCTSTSREHGGKPIGGRAGHWRIQLCFKNGNIPFDYVLHEIAHVAFTGPTDSYYKLDQGYPGSNPLSNADSFSNFVNEVGAPDWEEESQRAKDLEATAGISFSRGAVRPLFGARLEITPFGKGLRVFDFATAVYGLWSPATGWVPEGADPLTNKVQLGVDLLGRIRPSKSIYLDIGTGVLGSIAKEPDVDVTALGSLRWRPGGQTSGINLGIDLRAVFDNADLKPDQLIIGVSFGRSWSGEPKRRKPTRP